MVDPNSVPRYTFNNGKTVPVVGLGTWQSAPDGSLVRLILRLFCEGIFKRVFFSQQYRAVRAALDAGYRHLDCAFIYQNEEEIGKAIADAIKDGVVSRLIV